MTTTTTMNTTTNATNATNAKIATRRMFAGIDLLELRQTPVLLHSAHALAEQHAALRGAFRAIGRDVTIAFSWKTASPIIGEHYFARLEGNLHMTSMTHVAEADAAGCGDAIIYYTEPGLEATALPRLLTGRVHLSIDSMVQLDLVAHHCAERRRSARIGIRLDTELAPRDKDGNQTFYSPLRSCKGFTVGEAAAALARVRSNPAVTVNGLHTHLASQNTDLESWALCAGRMVDFAIDHALELDFFDLGGGFPIQYASADGFRVPTIDEIAAALRPALDRLFARWPAVRLVIEPGRFLCGPGGLLVTRVMARKERAGQEVLVLDDSRYSASRDIIVPYSFPVSVVHVGRSAAAAHAGSPKLVGKSASSNEVLCERADIAGASIGDLVLFGQTGAYTTVGASNFAGAKGVVEHLIEDGEIIATARPHASKWTSRPTRAKRSAATRPRHSARHFSAKK